MYQPVSLVGRITYEAYRPTLGRDIHSFYVSCEAGESEICIAVGEDLGVVV